MPALWVVPYSLPLPDLWAARAWGMPLLCVGMQGFTDICGLGVQFGFLRLYSPDSFFSSATPERVTQPT